VASARSEPRPPARPGDARHPRGRAAARNEKALGDELAVGRNDHAAGDAELGGQRARRRQRRPGVQPPRPHALAQLLLELHAQRRALRTIEHDVEVAAEVVHAIHVVMMRQ
jgi:hypothetical protein